MTGTGAPSEQGRWRSSRLIVVIAVLLLVPFGLSSVLTMQLATSAVRRQVDARLAVAAQAGAEEVGQEMAGLRQLVDSFASRPTLTAAVSASLTPGADVTGIRSHLESLMAARPGIATAFVADPSGALVDVVPESPEIVGENFAYRDWYVGVTASNEPYVSEVYRTAATGNGLVVAAAAPIHAGGTTTGPVIGILVAAYGVDTVQGFVDDFARAHGVTITVTDQNGSLAAEPGAAPTEVTSRATDAAIASALRGESGSDEVGDGEETRLRAHAPVATLGWAVTAEIDADVALADAAQLRTAIGAVTASLSAVIIGGLLVLARVLQRRDLADAELIESREELRASQDRLRLALDAGRLSIWEWDPVERRFAGTEGPLPVAGTEANTSALEHVVPDDRDRLSESLAAAVTGDADLDLELRVDTPTGGTRWIAAQGRAQGDPVRVVGVAGDVTDRHEAREALRAARDESDRANRAKSEFLSRMSHELRTPLNAVLGFNQLLAMDDLTAKQRGNVEFISSAGRHLLGLIDDVIDVSRIESGSLPLSLEPVHVNDIVGQAVDLSRPQADSQNISLVSHLAEADLFVRADRQRLLQVLLNLLSNAVKYNRPGGSIDVSITRGTPLTAITVTDTGFGISSANLEKLFVPFERLGAEATNIEGTGVGLALCQALTTQMGGELTVASTVGVGTSFTLKLAAIEPPASAMPSPEVAPTVATPGERVVTVLAIEDNVANLQLLERALAVHGNVELITSIQGRLGLEMAERHQPDLILLDLHLPDMAGTEVLRQVRGNPATALIPVAICSADASPGQSRRLLDAGAAVYLTKPIDLLDLFALVDRVRAGHDLETAPASQTPP